MAEDHAEPALRQDQVDASKPLPVCRWCTVDHTGEWCPRVAGIRYRKDGTIKRVDFIPPASPQLKSPPTPAEELQPRHDYPRYGAKAGENVT